MDVTLDWYSCASYFFQGDIGSGVGILVVLLIGMLAMGLMCAYVASNEYEGIKSRVLASQARGPDVGSRV